MLWNKNDEMFGFKAISEPKQFDKCQTIIWKRKGEHGYFVSVHTRDTDAALTKLKFHFQDRNLPPIEITPMLFKRMCSMLDKYPEFSNIAFDVTCPDPEFDAGWRDVLKRVAFIDCLPWSEEGTRFMVSLMLEEQFSIATANETTIEIKNGMNDVFPYDWGF